MSRASAALRRSGVRLRSLGRGHAPLNLLISEQSNTRQKYKDLIAAQISMSQTLERWSQEEENPALQDVLHHVCELNLLWAEAQRDFVVSLKEYKKIYERIREMEKKLDTARKQLSHLEDKEKKLQKDLVKGPKEPAITQEKLRQTSDSKTLAQAEVSGLERENEAVKLMTVRGGLLDLSQAWVAMGSKCNIIADSQKELALLIPDVGSARVQEIPTYSGTRESSRVVYSTRSKLELLHPPQYGTQSSSSELTSPPSYSASVAERSISGSSINSRSFKPTQPSEPTASFTSSVKTAGSVDNYEEDYQDDSFDSFESD